MKTQEELKFIEAAKRERYAFMKWLRKFNPFPSNYKVILTDYEFECYDVMIDIYENDVVVKKIIIEIKVRDQKGSACGYCRDGFWLERIKYNDLKDLTFDVPHTIFYMNFTTVETLMWKIDKNFENYVWKQRECPDSTCKDNKTFILKWVTALDSRGEKNTKWYDYKYTEFDYVLDMTKK